MTRFKLGVIDGNRVSPSWPMTPVAGLYVGGT
jgi:hypothetical protein